jgi:hypothetical protein
VRAVEPDDERVPGGAGDTEVSRTRTVVTLGLLAVVVVLAVIVPRLLSPAISPEEESPEGHYQAMCVLCHSFE